MIDHEYRVIFIHQRKVAGTSIIAAFGNLEDHYARNRYNDGALKPDWARREPDYFVFSAVRNPFDRLVSGWRHNEKARAFSLFDLLSSPPDDEVIYRHVLRPQVAPLRDPATGQLVVDDLIRYETLEDDFRRICNRICAPDLTLPNLNMGRYRDAGYRHYFDDRTRALAEERFADDLLTFGYSF